jgi:hypothetical protein
VSRTIRCSSVAQSVCNAAHGTPLFCCAIRSTVAVQSVRSAAHNLLPNVSPQVVQSNAMEPTPNHAFCESLLAAMPQLRKKPHLGVGSKNPGLHQGDDLVKAIAV